MRILLILVALTAAGFWMWGKAKDALGFAKDQKRPSLERSADVRNDSRKESGSGIGLPAVFGPGEKGKEIPKHSKLVRLQYREMPGADWVSQLSSLGLVCVLDPVGRSVYLQGPIDVVENVSAALAASDVVPGSCALQTFAVYVSREAVKGFDLRAALLAVAGGVNAATVELGGGGVSFEIGADRLAAALDVIADGQAVEVVQRPHVRLIDRVPAIVEAIDEIPVPSTTVSQGMAQTSIEYRKVGLQLRVEPVFLDSERMRLNVVQQNGIIGQNVEIDGNTVPIVQTQSVQSALEIHVGQTVVFGGVRTFRREKKRGLLRNTESIEEGALYVVLSTYSDAPRALEVRPEFEFPDDQDWIPSPGLPFGTSSSEWVDDMLLPSLPWTEDSAPAQRRKFRHPARK